MNNPPTRWRCGAGTTTARRERGWVQPDQTGEVQVRRRPCARRLIGLLPSLVADESPSRADAAGGPRPPAPRRPAVHALAHPGTSSSLTRTARANVAAVAYVRIRLASLGNQSIADARIKRGRPCCTNTATVDHCFLLGASASN